MDINIKNLGKRYLFDWIFKDINQTITQGTKISVLGPNGSGKSTLLKTLAGYTVPSKGEISYLDKNKKIAADAWYLHISYAAPYLQLVENFTCREMIEFHFKFKKTLQNMTVDDCLEISNLGKHQHKYVQHFSSGMKQRLKLSLALLSDVSIIFLDEPTANLDADSSLWYLDLVEQYAQNRTILVGSNEPKEYPFCTQTLNILDFKK